MVKKVINYDIYSKRRMEVLTFELCFYIKNYSALKYLLKYIKKQN